MEMLKSKFLQSDNIFLVDHNKVSVTYRDILEFSTELKFIKKNELSILIVENDLLSYKLYLGLLLAKKPFLILDKSLPDDFLNNFISDYLPTYIFSSSNFFASSVLHNIHFRKIPKNNTFTIDSNIALIIPTSGSTGDRKSVMLSYKALNINAKSISEYLELSQKDVSITNLPLSYAYGISILNSHFINGGKIVVTNLSIVQKEFWELFQEFDITNFNGVPYTYSTMERMNLNIFKSKNFRFFTQAGGHLKEEVKRKYLNFCLENNKEFYVMYGQTEAAPRISYLLLNRDPSKLNSIGIPIPNGKIYLKKDDIIIDTIMQEGELCYEGDNIYSGYAKSHNDLNSVQSIKVLNTGDIAYRDADGFYFITGRKSRFIKIDGKRFSLDSIQNELSSIFEIEVICIEKLGKIQIISEEEISLNDIFSKYMKKLSIRNSHYEFNKVKAFPRNITGKVMYKDLV